jgi:hypothetical protein
MKDLKLDGFFYDENTKDKLNSIYYTSKECEDNWIKITPVDDKFVITFVKGCEDIKMIVAATLDEVAINKEILKIYN